MNKRIKIILIAIASLIVIVGLTIAIIFIINNNDDNNGGNDNPSNTPKDDKLSYEKFSSVLKEFDLAGDLTIKEECLNDQSLSRLIKLDNDEFMVCMLETSDNELTHKYYEIEDNKYYRYIYDDPYWKRKEINEADLEYKLDLNLKRYSNSYQSFTYDKDNSTYKLTEYIDTLTYTNIEIKITDNTIRCYKFTLDDKDYVYTFTYYGNTDVVLPRDYYDIYEKFENDEWDELLIHSENIVNFTLSSIFEDKVGEDVFESNAKIGKYNDIESYETVTHEEGVKDYYYRINGTSIESYEKNISQWVLTSTNPTNLVSYNQKNLLPINILEANYDKIIYNEYANSYTLKDFEYDGKFYSEIALILENDVISYISIKYTYEINYVTHIVNQVIDFYDFGNTSIDVTI